MTQVSRHEYRRRLLIGWMFVIGWLGFFFLDFFFWRFTGWKGIIADIVLVGLAPSAFWNLFKGYRGYQEKDAREEGK